MTIKVNFFVHNDNPNTIWAKLASQLGREPSQSEAANEVRHILSAASDARLIKQAETGQLPWQKRSVTK